MTVTEIAQRLDTLESENQLLHARVAELEAVLAASVAVFTTSSPGADAGAEIWLG
jgi:hypothetical protein